MGEDYQPDDLDKAIADAGGAFEEAIKGMSPEALKEALLGRYNYLNGCCQDLQSQLNDVKTKTAAENAAVVARIEKLAALMTNQMSYLKQVVDLVDGYGAKLKLLKSEDAKQELQLAGIVERQNKFAVSVSRLAKNSEEIVAAIEELKSKDDDHDKFQWRIMCIFGIGVAVISWLLAGDHLAQIVVAIRSIFPS